MGVGQVYILWGSYLFCVAQLKRNLCLQKDGIHDLERTCVIPAIKGGLEGNKYFYAFSWSLPMASFFVTCIAFHFMIIRICKHIQVTSGIISFESEYIV